MRSAILACLGLMLALSAAPAHAHGTMESPVSRIYACYKEGPEAPKSAACKAVVQVGGTQPLYDWNEINQGQANGNHRSVIPDGTICSGGRAKYAGLDLIRSDWQITTIVPDAAGKVPFVFLATAVHASRYFDFYITRDNWNQAAPLTWNDLVKFASVNPPGVVDNRYRMNVALPARKTGRHVIFVVWQRSDSPEAFYSCSDVRIATTTGGTPSVTWTEAGQITAQSNLAAGSTATFRVFNATGGDAGRYTVTLTAATGKATMWPYTLAQAVNAASPAFKIGVLGTTGSSVTIKPVKTAAGNYVYRSSDYPGFAYEIDIDTPAGGGTWVEGASYAVGQTVTWQGKTYKCLQAHTAYVGTGWTPSSSPALWQLTT